jgi:hypothetical protein
VTVKSLVVTKLKLPTILRGDVVPLAVISTPVEPLIATPKRLWGVLHPDVGKRIKYRNRAAVIVNVRPHLRQIEIDNDRFWFPRRPEDHRSFRESRRKRRTKTVFVPPSWTGSPRPSGAETVPLRWVTDEFDHETIEFLTEHGFRSSWLGLRPFTSGGMSDYEKEQHELQQKEQRKRALLTVLNNSKSRMSTAMTNALFDVLFDGTKVGEAASSRGLNPRSLSMTVMRVTQRFQCISKAA